MRYTRILVIKWSPSYRHVQITLPKLLIGEAIYIIRLCMGLNHNDYAHKKQNNGMLRGEKSQYGLLLMECLKYLILMLVCTDLNGNSLGIQ